ncbi:hypothetical protein RND71_026425 [Anisodus tanguticus]|uniref:Uncharacterized protein n=1 Tax=Anisodus tanguticus TaxID=243964 RepID=A0AAE1RNJ3_9SOLA|nr:hypothetical protein RND71_026425 [Anisodus tanguticus]
MEAKIKRKDDFWWEKAAQPLLLKGCTNDQTNWYQINDNKVNHGEGQHERQVNAQQNKDRKYANKNKFGTLVNLEEEESEGNTNKQNKKTGENAKPWVEASFGKQQDKGSRTKEKITEHAETKENGTRD